MIHIGRPLRFRLAVPPGTPVVVGTRSRLGSWQRG